MVIWLFTLILFLLLLLLLLLFFFLAFLAASQGLGCFCNFDNDVDGNVFIQNIDRDPHEYTRRVIKEAIYTRLYPNNINRDNGIEILEAWMPTIKQHNSRSVLQGTSEETASNQNNEDRDAPITNNQGATYTGTDPDQQHSGRNVAIHIKVTKS